MCEILLYRMSRRANTVLCARNESVCMRIASQDACRHNANLGCSHVVCEDPQAFMILPLAEAACSDLALTFR